MTSPLSGIEAEKRRRLAATLGLFAMLFVAVGAVAATGATTGMIKGFVVVAMLVAALLALISWGVLRSVRLDLADQRLDAAIEAAVRSSGRTTCGCGVEHDPDEMHFVDGEGQHVSGAARARAAAQTGAAQARAAAQSGAARVRVAARSCAQDGTGTDCTHSCDTCALAAMRPSPHRTRAERLQSPA